jgi:hypothetical protein
VATQVAREGLDGARPARTGRRPVAPDVGRRVRGRLAVVSGAVDVGRRTRWRRVFAGGAVGLAAVALVAVAVGEAGVAGRGSDGRGLGGCVTADRGQACRSTDACAVDRTGTAVCPAELADTGTADTSPAGGTDLAVARELEIVLAGREPRVRALGARRRGDHVPTLAVQGGGLRPAPRRLEGRDEPVDEVGAGRGGIGSQLAREHDARTEHVHGLVVPTEPVQRPPELAPHEQHVLVAGAVQRLGPPEHVAERRHGAGQVARVDQVSRAVHLSAEPGVVCRRRLPGAEPTRRVLAHESSFASGRRCTHIRRDDASLPRALPSPRRTG